MHRVEEKTTGFQFRNMLLLDRLDDLSQNDILYPFALDELLCRTTGQGGPAICHIWRHQSAFVMGLRDSRLPEAESAQRWLESQGRSVAVRNSGGAAVPLDLGVINISLIMPKESVQSFHFHQDFERMYHLIKLALEESGCQVDKGEIQGAFCPGDFDLSINGLKFCGIAQRRQTHAFIVQAFVIAEGSGQKRAELVRSFYEHASVGSLTFDHPIVTGSSMASLEELTNLGPNTGRVFADALKRIIVSEQRLEDMANAETELAMVMPSPEQILEMIHKLRIRYAIEKPVSLDE